MDNFKAGDVVQLRSGGPKMTVSAVEDYYGTMHAMCDWFVADKAPWKQESDRFPLTSLKIVPE
jgi:uncharacterized protein YodC (DUF2158 family)